MKNGVSEIIGQALFGDGAKGTAYRALRPLVCSRCGGLVADGEMFTRDHASGQQGLRLWPRCQACVPFALDAGKPTRSALLQSLLTPTKQEPAAITEHRGEPDRATPDKRQEADERLKADEQPNADERLKAEDERQAAEDERHRVNEAMRRRLGPALERSRRWRDGNR
jgi:hypothetical protein